MVSHHRLVAIQFQRHDASSRLSFTTVKFSPGNIHGRCRRKPVSCHMPAGPRPGWAQTSDCGQEGVCGCGSWLAFPQQLIPSRHAGRQCEAAQTDRQNANREFRCHLATLIFSDQVKKSTWQFPGQKGLERDRDLNGFTAREPFQGSLPSA